MSLLQWSNRLDVHVEAMNQEHAHLIDLMNTVYDANTGADRAGIISALDTLVRFVVKHFQNEEAYMESIGFSGLKTHRYIHKDLLERVGKFVDEFKRSESDRLSREFFEFLKFWLVSHIQGIDTKYGESV